MRSRPVVDITTQCACGAVTVHFAGPVLSMFLCACEACQKATGSGHAAVVLAGEESVAIGGPLTEFARPANSGATLTRSFCPVCGTPVVARSNRAASVVMLPAGLFGADTEWYAPGQLIFARSHRAWDEIAADLPRHDTYRDGGATM